MRSLLVFFVSSTLVGVIWAQDSGEPSAPGIGSRGSDPILLRHRFESGRSRRYQVTSVTTEDLLDAECPVARIRDHYRSHKEPRQTRRIAFIEEERCESVTPSGVAAIAYRCESFHAKEESGETVAMDLRVQGVHDLYKAKGEHRVTYLAALVEGSVRYSLSPDMRVADIRLPRELPNGAGKVFEENYGKALQARYHTFFPAHAISAGDSWTGKIGLDDGLWNPAGLLPDADYVVTSRHAGWEDAAGKPCVVIEMRVSMNVDVGTPVVKGAFQSLYVDRFEGLSRIRFDPAAGRVVDEDTKIDARVRRELSVRDSVKITQPIVIRQTIESRLLPELPSTSSEVPPR